MVNILLNALNLANGQKKRIFIHQPPIASNETVSKVPEPDILRVVDRHDVADDSAVDDLLDLDNRRKVPENMTHGQHYSCSQVNEMSVTQQRIKILQYGQ